MALVEVAQEDQLVVEVAVLVDVLEAVLAPGLGPQEASSHHAWTKESPSRATGWSIS